MGGQNLAIALGSISSMVEEVEYGEGLLHNLIYEPGGEQVQHLDASLVQLGEASKRANNILAKVDQGDGTLALLLNDPGVYEDLRVVLEDAQGLLGRARKNKLIRSLIKYSGEEE